MLSNHNQSKSSPDKHFIAIFFIFFIFGLSTSPARGQSTIQIGLAGGASYSYAPKLAYDNFDGTGNLINVFGDLVINDKLIGRLQYSRLQSNTLKADLENRLSSGFSITGAGGYIFSLGESSQLELPVMFTGGYTSVTLTNGINDPGMHLGLTLSPQYQVMDNLYIMSSFRYLKGIGVNGGATIDVADIAIGVRYRFL